jgi:hypothetical protein
MKKSFLIVFLLLFSIPIIAQQRWGGGVDYDRIHFGFSFHYMASSFKVFKNAEWKNPYSDPSVRGPLKEIASPMKGGVGLGLLADLRLGDNTNLRFSPTILFAEKIINYSYADSINLISREPNISNKDVKASLLELPLTFKFKSDRRKNYGVYLLGGGKYSRNVARLKDDSNLPDNEKKIKLKPNFFSYEFGLGVDIYFEYFKMSPEIKWSQSLGNVLDKSDPNAFNSPIDKLLLRSIQFSLIFE